MPSVGPAVCCSRPLSNANGGKVIDELVRAGIVLEERAGKARMITLNDEHFAVPAIRALAPQRGRLIQLLREHFAEAPGVKAAWLFGSAARGDGGVESDIDLYVVRLPKRNDHDWDTFEIELRSDVQRRSGNSVQLVSHTPESLRELVAAAKPPAPSSPRVDASW